MPEVELTEEQYEYLESLREEITEEFVGPYGHARISDALQYLIDTHDGEVNPTLVDGDVGDARTPESDPAAAESEHDDDDEADESDGGGAPEAADGDSDEEKLNSMMQLLDEYDDVWEKAGSDAGYDVELPDGGTETVKTKDDVRALLFKHYQ